MTEFHFILLYKDRIRAICHLNDEIVYEEMITLVRINESTTLHGWFAISDLILVVRLQMSMSWD